MKTEVAAALAAGVLLFLAGILVGRRPASGEAREIAGAGQTLGTGIDLRLRRYEEVGIAGLILAVTVLSQPASFSQSWLLVRVGWMAT